MKRLFLHHIISGLVLLASFNLLAEEWLSSVLFEDSHAAWNLEEDVEIFESSDWEYEPSQDNDDYFPQGYGLFGMVHLSPYPVEFLKTDIPKEASQPQVVEKLYILFHCLRYHC